MNVGKRIMERRVELNMSREELAKKCDYVSGVSIERIEAEKSVATNKVEKIAKALDCTPGYLAGWEKRSDELTEKEKKLFRQIHDLNNNDDTMLAELVDAFNVILEDYSLVKLYNQLSENDKETVINMTYVLGMMHKPKDK